MRRLVRTNLALLLVGEGDAEMELGYVMRDCYLPRGCGKSLTLRNAHGFGGARALELAIDIQKQSAYDFCGVIVDTDTDWTDAERQRARDAGIHCIENSPCLEATLLAVGGHRTHQSTRNNKAAFLREYGSPAHRAGLIGRHFGRDEFDAARARVAAIDAFLQFLRC